MIHATNWTRSSKRRTSRTEESEVLPYQTPSICPECLSVVNAVLYEEDDLVLMKKYCSRHGTFTELISSDATFYRLYPFCTYNSGPCHRRQVEEQYAGSLGPAAFGERSPAS